MIANLQQIPSPIESYPSQIALDHFNTSALQADPVLFSPTDYLSHHTNDDLMFEPSDNGIWPSLELSPSNNSGCEVEIDNSVDDLFPFDFHQGYQIAN